MAMEVEDGGGGAIEAGDGGGDKVGDGGGADPVRGSGGGADPICGDGGGADQLRGNGGGSNAARGDGGGADPVRGGAGGSDAARGDGGGADPVRGGAGGSDAARGDGGGADPVRGGAGGSDAACGVCGGADPVRSGGSGSVAARGDGGVADPVCSGGDGVDAACGDSGGARAVSHVVASSCFQLCRCFMVQAISFSAISIISAGQKLICSHSSASSLKVGCSSDSSILLFPNRRNHVGFVIRVELGPPDEPRGDPLLSPVTHTPKSTAQHQTSVLCRFRGGSRWGLTVCQADCTSFEAQGSSRRGFAADPCRLAPFSDVRLFQEGCFRSSVNPPFLRMALLLGYVMGFIP
ncbi:antigen-like protein [Oryza sativa Japonica Group]|uniref:Antigen-like protein n=2 Tax=Oryza sativa subsp. japonica TaxID=39947 RepID=A0A0P0V8Y4_ORYSJ|nr:hypothetical protein DAI22_01g348500 [Oryza sativa Japonica Group]BAD52857.1 antigen-like protein [Oryza sativa Japonica Group]BAD53275.1 antigen-like protein [Oryza sativa Japonica Group]BAF06354.2 Os01g0780900 [Oryza sativa Japonica Group]BAS74644.1 Os01g0780900 [Oryza sativa Japonica Group]|eukprot:NP_001044440.2 Os01g0780900 [Oryza sativa Japonica Group]